MGACPQWSIQNNSEFGMSLLNSWATSGGVMLSCFPQIKQVFMLILGKSVAKLWRIADFASDKMRMSLLLSLITS